MEGRSYQTKLLIGMMASVNNPPNKKPKKELDIRIGDVVYFRNDPRLEAGIGIVLLTEFRSFDICDFRDLGITCFMNQRDPASMPKIFVLWVGGNKRMWMDKQDIALLQRKGG